MRTTENIVLIGMPAAGKSTVGVLLAKRLGYRFIDSDLLIQEQENRLLKDIIEQEGMDGYMAIENQVNRDIQSSKAIIAPGGSVIYCQEAMEHLREIGLVVYLQISCEGLKKRLGDLIDRGVVIAQGMTLEDLYEERKGLYEKYADIIIDEGKMNTGEIVDHLRAMVEDQWKQERDRK